jgi:hypothetical protein
MDLDNIYLQTKNTLAKNLSVYEAKVKSKYLEIQDTIRWIEDEEKRYNVLYLKLS